ncbi:MULTISPECIES: hypothetical protein [Bradyrhizobium]|nr:hypothetical protein [Bradyrhizobium japonicum]MBR0916245.1 hypothetical protein [Bradyrhizobium japonicum]MCS3897324.1 uncharacterized protein (DUF697 family) [Bradyrhizobium japonicum USDA 38]MCS3949839.1 uncharacterized protein (DUF697 family) [Bradyrhizobium japonicum]
MHDIDRTQLEYSQEAGPFQQEEFELQEFELGAMAGEMSEQEEIQLAHELLAVNNEQELEQFLGSFIRRAVSTVGQIAKSPIGQAIGGVLKSVARKALPMAGAALGGYIGGPLGAKIGNGLANAAGKAIGLEQEFGESEELEFAGARQFVRLASNTARQAAAAAAAGADPRLAAQSAALAAARKFAPGLVGWSPGTGGVVGMAAPLMGHRPKSGRWLRRGHQIVLFGV